MRPREPSTWTVVVRTKGDARASPRFAGEPGAVQPEYQRPAPGSLARADRPSPTLPGSAQSPIGIPTRRLPSRAATTIDHAAVHHPAEVPLKVVMSRDRATVTGHVQADHEIVAPIRRGVRHPGRPRTRNPRCGGARSSPRPAGSGEAPRARPARGRLDSAEGGDSIRLTGATGAATPPFDGETWTASRTTTGSAITQGRTG